MEDKPIARPEVSLREYELTVVYDLAVTEAGGPDAGRALDGDYVVTRVELDPTAVAPLEAALKIDEKVYRHLVVRADELPLPPPPREPRAPREPAAEAAPAAAPAPAAEAAPVAAAEAPVAEAPAAEAPAAEAPAETAAEAPSEE